MYLFRSVFLIILFSNAVFGHNTSWNKATITLRNNELTVTLRLVQIDVLGAVQPGEDSTRLRSHAEWTVLLPDIRSYIFDNTFITIDNGPLADIINESWHLENAPVRDQGEHGDVADTGMGMILLSRSWRIEGLPKRVSWRSDIFGNVDVPVKWVVLMSTDPSSEKRIYTTVHRSETVVYDVTRNKWETEDGKIVSSADERTVWGKIKQFVTVGFNRVNLQEFFTSSGSLKGMFFYFFVAILIGAFHALSPGHGKALIGAYIVGTKGTVLDAVTLGIVTALSHTISVFVLGVVLLLVFDTVVPSSVMVYINIVSGLIIMIIGAILLRQRLRELRYHSGHTHTHHIHTHHTHADEEHSHIHSHHEHEYEHGHGHHHISMESIHNNGFCTNVVMGISGGIVPCPTALAVLFLAVSLQMLPLGMLLIVFFSAGLAVTLTLLGILLAKGTKLIDRYDNNRVVSKLPVVSSGIIILVGLVMVIRVFVAV